MYGSSFWGHFGWLCRDYALSIFLSQITNVVFLYIYSCCNLPKRGVLWGKSEHGGYTITLDPLRARARFWIDQTVSFHGYDKPNFHVQVDCWSLGVILYILPSGTPPFSEDRWLFVSSQLICPTNIELTVCMAGPVDWIWELKYSR